TMYAEIHVDAAADMVRGTWADARTQAIEDLKPYRFAVKPDTGEFRLAPDGDDFANLAVGLSDSGLVRQDTLPSGVKFTLAAGSGGATDGEWTTVAVFLPNGEAQDDVSITFETE